MRIAGVYSAYVVLRKGKWDIPSCLGDGSVLGMNLSYLIMGRPYGTPYSLDQAYYFVESSMVAFGFPDILFPTQDAFAQLFAHQSRSEAEIVLGLFSTDNPSTCDMVCLAEHGRVSGIVTNPVETDLRWTWCIAAWTPVFTRFLHEYLRMHQRSSEKMERVPRDLGLGEVIQEAIRDGICVEGVQFPGDSCLDLGTPVNLAKAVATAQFHE
jgi:glucose-1-phosphate thymidylyltransferase